MNTALMERVQELAAQRATLAAKKAELAERKQAFDNENRELTAEINRISDSIATSEIVVRTVADEVYAANGEKKPAPGVEIKLFETISYDQQAAFAWAQQTKLALIPEQLDVKAFEKIAKATPLPFVTKGSEARVSIATDLVKALAVAEVTAE